MKVAIMQPYVFPYIGYFQLIHAVDVFVFYDDVNFIKSGWIHRNRINTNGVAAYFSIPLVKQSSFMSINDTEINSKLYHQWQQKFSETLIHHYKNAPHFEEIHTLVNSVLKNEVKAISELAIISIEHISNYLDMNVAFKISSKDFSQSKGLDKADRLITITKELKGNHYINLMGGKTLYEKDYFLNQGLELSFIKGSIDIYDQGQQDFIPALSIIDVLMYNSKEEVKVMLHNYQLT